MRKLTTEEWIAKARLIHGTKYDYAKSYYLGTHNKVIITCITHGEFEQTPHNHLNGQGCLECSKLVKTDTINIKYTEEFLTKAKLVHGHKYDYSKVVYIHSQNKVTIGCPIHGDFEQVPQDHIRGRGCKQCGTQLMAELRKKDTVTFIEEAILFHGIKYDYANSVYVDATTKIKIFCPMHGEFEQRPGAHTAGHGCPTCAKHGFDVLKPAILYYLKINGGQVYKIGITNRTVKERFNNTELQLIEIIHTWYYENGSDAYDEEQRILNSYKSFKYTGPDILASGNTELFTTDVLKIHDDKLF